MGFSKSGYDGWLDKHFAGLSGVKTVIELGCGYGDDTSFLLLTGHSVISCDYSEESIDGFRARNPGAAIRKLDFREPLPFDTGSSDIVIASLCLHFYPEDDLKRILAEINRVLRSDGLFLCRLNSEGGRFRNVPGELELGAGMYLTGEGPKRFFTEEMIRTAFGQWNIKNIEEYETFKFSKRKTVFEIAMTP